MISRPAVLVGYNTMHDKCTTAFYSKCTTLKTTVTESLNYNGAIHYKFMIVLIQASLYNHGEGKDKHFSCLERLSTNYDFVLATGLH